MSRLGALAFVFGSLGIICLGTCFYVVSSKWQYAEADSLDALEGMLPRRLAIVIPSQARKLEVEFQEYRGKIAARFIIRNDQLNDFVSREGLSKQDQVSKTVYVPKVGSKDFSSEDHEFYSGISQDGKRIELAVSKASHDVFLNSF